MEIKALKSWIIISLLLMSLAFIASVQGGKTSEIFHANDSQSTVFTPPSIEWNKTYGVDTSPACGIQTEDGGYAIAGSIQLQPEGTTAYLIKTDDSGNTQWDKTYSEVSFVDSIVQTNDGGFAIVCSGGGTGGLLLVKTDAAGNTEWNKTYYSGEGDDRASSLIQTSDGGYAIVGTMVGVHQPNRYWLIKTDSSGNKLWDKGYGDTGLDSAFSGIETKDGGYAIIGMSGFYDSLLIKTDSSGNMQWNQTYNGITQYHSIQSILQTSNGGYAIAGSIDNSISDFWLARTDSLGNMQWNKTYGGTGDSYAASLIQTSDGGYAMIGNTDLNSSIPMGGGFDIWVVKTDSEGNPQWNQTYVGNGQDGGVSIIQTKDGGYALLAYVPGHGIFLLKLAAPAQPSTLPVSDIVLYAVTAAVIAIAVIVAIEVYRKRKK
jgi:hypothetical protein